MSQISEIESLLLKQYPICNEHKNTPMTHICVSKDCDKSDRIISCTVCISKYHGSKIHQTLSLKEFFLKLKKQL